MHAYSAFAEIFTLFPDMGELRADERPGDREQEHALKREQEHALKHAFWSHQPCTCKPHSVLAAPLHLPARSSSPAATARVQGQQPMLR